MTRIRLLLALLLGAGLAADASAQIVVPTPFGFQQLAPAYLPYYGNPYYAAPIFGSVERRGSGQGLAPMPTVVVRTRRPSYDLSGIDLDVETPDKLWGSKAPKNSELVKAPGAA